MERSDPLFARVDEKNTETPSACQIIALRLAGTGHAIPDDIRNAVISSAVRGDGVLKELMLEVNASVNSYGIQNHSFRERFLRLAAQIAFSQGVNSPEACQRRLDYLREALYKDENPDPGRGFTE